MSTFASLLIALIPTLVGLALLGVADPKRRRIQGKGSLPTWERPVGITLCLLSGCFILAAGGFAAVLIWVAALGSAGWAMTNGLSPAPSWMRARLDIPLSRLTNWMAARPRIPIFQNQSQLSALRSTTDDLIGRPNAVLFCVIVCALFSVVAAAAAWRAAATNAIVAQRLAMIDATAMLKDIRLETPATSLCLDALNKSQSAGSAVRDLLSKRSFSITLATDGSAGDANTNLQRCILASGDDGAAVEEDKSKQTETYIVSEQAAVAIHDAILNQLTGYESLAALATDTPDFCRQTATLIDPNILRFVALLQRDRTYAKIRDLLEDHRYLDRASSEGGPCP